MCCARSGQRTHPTAVRPSALPRCGSIDFELPACAHRRAAAAPSGCPGASRPRRSTGLLPRPQCRVPRSQEPVIFRRHRAMLNRQRIDLVLLMVQLTVLGLPGGRGGHTWEAGGLSWWAGSRPSGGRGPDPAGNPLCRPPVARSAAGSRPRICRSSSYRAAGVGAAAAHPRTSRAPSGWPSATGLSCASGCESTASRRRAHWHCPRARRRPTSQSR